MSINFKPINEVPMIDEFSEGDTVLVNCGGTAKQIDASKVGGGGGGIVYISSEFSGEMVYAPAYADSELTTQLTYEQGIALCSGGALIEANMEGQVAWVTPLAAIPMADAKAIMCFCMVESIIQIALIFSDTNMDA